MVWISKLGLLKWKSAVSILVYSFKNGNGLFYILTIDNIGIFQALYLIHWKVLRWIFAFDHVHYYTFWLSIHQMLKETNPEKYHELDDNGKINVKRAQNRFSMMWLNQCHEQLNLKKDVKSISKEFRCQSKSLFFLSSI